MRQPCHVNGDDFSDAALVVLGHGTTQNENSAAPVYQHAAELRRRKIFAEVREAFWKQEPQIKKVLPEISAPRVFIVPLFISVGYFSDEVIRANSALLPVSQPSALPPLARPRQNEVTAGNTQPFSIAGRWELTKA